MIAGGGHCPQLLQTEAVVEELASFLSPYVRITEALVGGRVGNPRGLTGLALARGHTRGRDSLRRPPARGRHSLPGVAVGPTLSSLSLWRLSGKAMTPSPRRAAQRVGTQELLKR